MALSSLGLPEKLLQILPPMGSLRCRLELSVDEDAEKTCPKEPKIQLLPAPLMFVPPHRP